MKHMNTNLVGLLYEGFSIQTLESLNEEQLRLLYEKVKKIETKEEESKITKVYNLGNIEDKNKFIDATKNVTDKNKITFDPTKDTASVSEKEIKEKAVSKKQRGLMGAAYSVEKGEKDLEDIPKSYRKKVEKVVDSMSKKQVKDFASTKDKGLPEKKESKENVKKLEENIMSIIKDYLPPMTTKKDLLSAIKNYKR